jgi:dTDP-4-dehydrorhamnose 3,5-epimerase
MIFTKTPIDGAIIIDVEKIEDDRGFFARSWDKKVFEKNGLNSNLLQCNISFNKKKGTVRGMHYQAHPYEEAKLVRCTRGSAFEVIIDIRSKSNSYKKWFGIELSDDNHKMLYVPEGVALGFQTLENDTELFYQMSQEYMPEFARGIRWDDPTFKISWPYKVTVISDRDSKLGFFKE